MGQRPAPQIAANDEWETVSAPARSAPAANDEWETVSAPVEKPALPGPDTRTWQNVMTDNMDASARGSLGMITGIPKALAGVGSVVWDAVTGKGTKRGQEMIEDMVKAPARMLGTTAQGFGALVAPDSVKAPSDAEFQQASEGAGATLAGLAGSEALPYVGRAGKSVSRAVLKDIGYDSAAFQEMAAANKARALGPTTLQARSDAGLIGEEMSKRGQAAGWRGKTIDRNIISDLEKHGEQVRAVETRLTADPRPELQTSKQSLLSEIDAARNKLNLPRLKVSASPEAIGHFDKLRGMVDQLPDYIDFDQLIELKRQLDQRAEDAGAFGVNADSLKAAVNRGGADMVRGKLNALDPELKAANHDYSVSRKAADMVKRRELGETGKIGHGLPGRGAILDDILATWAGHALGGPVGGAVMEVGNLARQSRGFANIKGGLQQKLAEFMKTPTPQPAGLLGPGPIPMGPSTDSSFVRGQSVRQPLQLGTGEGQVVNATLTGRGGGGQVFHMPPRAPLLLPQGRMLLPERTGGPLITPLKESLRDQVRRMTRKH